MNQLILSILFFLPISLFAGGPNGPVNLVLVPGFFSSAVPAPDHLGNPWDQPYYSKDIVHFLSTRSSHLWVVDTLNPVGGVEENGQRLVHFLERRAADFGNKPIVLLSHSAGGLYSLYAAANSSLPISQIITMSTPFKGLKLLQAVEEKGVPIATLAAPFCLDNLLGLKTKPVVDFLQSLNLSKPLRLDVFAGYQTTSLMTWDWHYLSAPLVPFQALIQESSDGIVNVQSALNPEDLLRRNQGVVDIHVHPERLNLEHWEMILDAELTHLYGVLNADSLRSAQAKIYSDVLTKSGF